MEYRRVAAAVLLALVVVLGPGQSRLCAAPSKESEADSPPVDQQKAKTAEHQAGEDVDEYELQRMLVDTIDQVQRNYVKGISRRELIEAAIEGVLEKLDPYSTYIGPKQIERFRREVENEFCGIGIKIDVENGQLTVISPLVGTPAYRAGILSGDRIMRIDGKPTGEISIDEAVSRLKGREGSQVVLSVLHAGESEPVEIAVTRSRIHVKTVLADSRDKNDDWDYMIDKRHRIGYVRVTVFGRETAEELREVLENLKKQGLEALVLDLRFNPGGLLHSAVEISDMFVPAGLIVSTSGRNVKQRQWKAKPAGTFAGFPMVVLVNRITASAGEIVAACLQDHRRAVVMGERTWGKGSVQNVIALEEGLSALKLTTASYCRPSGKNIHRFPDSSDDDLWGVVPDEGFALRTSTADMIALIRSRSRRDIVSRADEKRGNGDKDDGNKGNENIADRQPDESPESPQTTADPLLQMALDYLVNELLGDNNGQSNPAPPRRPQAEVPEPQHPHEHPSD